MAESYSYLGSLSRAPSIDVDLFPRAMAQGTNVGLAVPNTAGAIFEGINKGIQTGIQTYQGVQQIQINNAKLAELGTPEQQQATADANLQIKQAQATTATAQAEAQKITAVDVAKTVAAQAVQTLSDIQAKNRALDLFSNSTPTSYTADAALQDPQIAGAMQRDLGFASSFLAKTKGIASPDVYDRTAQGLQAIQDRQMSLEVAKKTAISTAAAAEKKNTEYGDANLYIGSRSPTLKSLTSDPGYTGDLELVRSDRITEPTDPTTGRRVLKDPIIPNKDAPYVWMANGQPVPNTPEVNAKDYEKASKELDLHKEFRTAHNAPVTSTGATPTANTSTQTGGGLATQNLSTNQAYGGPVPAPAPTPGGVPQEILDSSKKENEVAIKNLGASTYNQMKITGQAITGKLQPKSAPSTYLTTTQATPTPPNTPALTAPTPTSTTTPSDPSGHVASVLGVKKDNISYSIPVEPLHQGSFDTVNSIPQLKNSPALLKGLVYIESRGNANAISPAGAKGLTQLMPGTAKEVGVTNTLDMDQNVQGGLDYLIKKYDETNKKLTKVYTDAGYPAPAVDPRIFLAAYNGGFTHIEKAISAGNTNWDSITQYIKANNLKSPAKYKQNIEYPDKVLNASLPFIKGGNVSDNLYVSNLIQSGIIAING